MISRVYFFQISAGQNREDSYTAPKDISSKYMVGDIIGDGNFAVVRRCKSRKTKQEFALKIIDKSKCQGKEHMIESEIAILTLVSHPHIIELLEVFDFPEEKYLVTEFVRGGDLFDAIAIDTKYSERVSRRMVADMTSALKYLHDKMIVHRDIKPENLLVLYLEPEDKGPERLRSLKLGDFGLAQLVSEPLFTVSYRQFIHLYLTYIYIHSGRANNGGSDLGNSTLKNHEKILEKILVQITFNTVLT